MAKVELSALATVLGEKHLNHISKEFLVHSNQEPSHSSWDHLPPAIVSLPEARISATAHFTDRPEPTHAPLCSGIDATPQIIASSRFRKSDACVAASQRSSRSAVPSERREGRPFAR